MERHIHHEFHELILMVDGTLEVHIQGDVIQGHRGDLLYYPQGAWHAEEAVGGDPLETLFVAWQGDIPPSTDAWPLSVTDRNGRAQMLLHWMHDLFPPTRSDEGRALDVLLEALLFEVAQLSQTREERMVSQVKAFIQHHITEPLVLDDLAKEADLSKYYFCREFKKATGTTPMAFVRQMRVEVARSLLLSTSWTHQAIATQVGFSDEFQLSRVFRRVTGVPPSQVRE